MTTATKLTYLGGTKAAIKTAIEAKGVSVGDATFRQYADKVALIEGGSGAPAFVTFKEVTVGIHPVRVPVLVSTILKEG